MPVVSSKRGFSRIPLLIFTCLLLPFSKADENALEQKLLQEYNTNVRPPPVGTTKGPVIVEFHMVFFGIMDLNPKLMIFTTNAQVIMRWKDPRLKWNPANEGQVAEMKFRPSQVWLPDIILYNCATANYEQNMYTTFVNVNYTGDVTYMISGYFFSSCPLDYGYFPFDEQHCPLIFTPWTMSSKTVKLVPRHRSGDLSQYSKNGEFRMISLQASNYTFFNPCCDEDYDVLSYNVEIQRRSLFYVLKYIYPSLLINALASMVFYIPCESGEKVTMGISAMLNMIVFLMNAANDLPSMPVYPYLSIYYCVSVGLLTLQVFMSCVGMKMFFRSQQSQMASDFAIAVAFIMAKLSFTDLRDPRGYFKRRKEYMLSRFFNQKRKTSTELRTNRPPSLSVSDIDDDVRSVKPWRDPSPASAERTRQLMAFNLMDKKYLGSPSNIASKFGAVRPRLSKSTDSSISSDASIKTSEAELGSADLSINVTNIPLEEKVEKLLKVVRKHEKAKQDEDEDELLKMEFEALSRVYDRFFLIMSLLFTVLLSCSVFWVSPYATQMEGN